jgi:hypothetical protein
MPKCVNAEVSGRALAGWGIVAAVDGNQALLASLHRSPILRRRMDASIHPDRTFDVGRPVRSRFLAVDVVPAAQGQKGGSPAFSIE